MVVIVSIGEDTTYKYKSSTVSIDDEGNAKV